METKIYIACLAAYNSGILHGKWVDLTDETTEETLREEIAAILAASPIPGAEEWAIHDTESLPRTLGENPDLGELLEIAANIREHGTLFSLYMDATGKSCDEAAGDFADSYAGAFTSRETFGAELFEECGYMAEIPEHLQCYVDTDGFANDLFLGGDYFEIHHDCETHVFRST